jgi:hypothetical protein
LCRDPATGTASIRHKENITSEGRITDIPIGAFLNGPRSPEREALLRLIGTLVPDTPEADLSDDQLVGNTRREWSNAELTELGDLLLCQIPLEEIARLLERDYDDVQDKVVEIGRACR